MDMVVSMDGCVIYKALDDVLGMEFAEAFLDLWLGMTFLEFFLRMEGKHMVILVTCVSV